MEENCSMMDEIPVIRAFRGDLCENVHFASVVVATTTGVVVQMFPGSNHRRVFLRSAAKPFQALPLYQNPASRNIPLPEWAIICASHAATPVQLELVQSVLARANATEADLQCGPHPPLDESAAKDLICRGFSPSAIHNNCSGKHAGMLLACRAYGWPLENYLDIDHPLQQAILKVVRHYAGTNEIDIAVDGCGAPIFGLTLGQAARMTACLATDDNLSPIKSAMIAYPEIVGGAQRIDSLLMRVTAGNLVAKVGAEGMLIVGNSKAGQAMALKVHDGNNSIRDLIAIQALRDLDWISASQEKAIRGYPQYGLTRLNTQGKAIGRYECTLPWQ